MKMIIGQIAVIARRDFLAVVATPTFLLFLLAPFFMLGISVASGMGGNYLARSTATVRTIVVVAPPTEAAQLTRDDEAMRKRLYPPEATLPVLRIVAPEADSRAQQTRLFADRQSEVTAIMRGPLTKPLIVHQRGEARAAALLATLAEESLRTQRLGGDAGIRLSQPEIRPIVTAAPTKNRQQKTGFAAVLVIFMLTLILASQAVGTMVEEKSNKVLEILAAAVPLEAVFFGKLIGLFGVAMLFVSFWGVVAGLAFSMLPTTIGLSTFAPTIGLIPFILFGAAYFTMAYMLLGAVFLGIGAQASTMREIQMLSLPITIVQMAMFGLASAAASSPGTTIALVAEIFPFSSPFAMAAHGATDAAIWPHLLALAWQALWVAITIRIAARLFRAGVLNSGSGMWTSLWRRRTKRPAPLTSH
jgi:ABC-2 type transport system permease protein